MRTNLSHLVALVSSGTRGCKISGNETEGCSMSRGREARHAAMVLACVALMALSAGCRSPFQKLAEKTAPGSSPDRADSGLPPLQPLPENWSGTANAAISETGSKTESLSGPAAPVPTPLLDAALKHAEAIEHVHREAIAAGQQPLPTNVASQPDGHAQVPAAESKNRSWQDEEQAWSIEISPNAVKPQVSAPSDVSRKPGSEPSKTKSPDSDPPGRPSSGSAATVLPVGAHVVDWLAGEAAKPANQALFQRAVNTIADAVKSSAKDDRTKPADIRAAVLALEDRESLGVSNLRLCRGVSGFGSFEPLPASALRAGQSFLLYCELTGLRYEDKDTSYLSRLSSRIELVWARDGTKQWEQSLGETEDRCRSRRRDNYVNYRITLPLTLPAGDYRLRLTQTDLVANRSASSELPMTIVR
jgi:hypothetical protein